ncbi:hypothetical protein WA1_27155 [Scytonema hofmannii PCC 7110]|uniref:Uncharacterized protein n=1 Tax=Scytonema hofmannii PCC 7110 TaxID=128403 RepID=A0A139X693_9CYAN|nr:hypothetical protein [Scytonema hofmannii]KYC40218.1 hypothetical protein WA1_27155 [Scytonema hofmannii PCC 7110]
MPKIGLAKLVILTAFILFVSGSSYFLNHSLPAQALAATQKQFAISHFQSRSSKEKHSKVLTSQEQTLIAQTNTNCAPVESGKIFRFIDGTDSCVAPMTEQEIGENLNDPFAAAILRKGIFPDSVDAIVTEISNSGLNLQQANYLLGEGSQIPTTVVSREAPRNLRYVLTWGTSPTSSAQILLNAPPGGDSSFLQVISWNAQAKRYNFYEFREQVGEIKDIPTRVWVWAGDSPMAQAPQTMGHGCFDCHHNGVVIMKELAFPWNNWHSQRATISPLNVPIAVAQEQIFQNLNGAEILERVIRSGFQIYHQNWLRDRVKNEEGTIRLTDVNKMLRHLTTNTTINLTSTNIESNGANTSPANSDLSGIPNDFFLWDSALRTALNLNYTIQPIQFKRNDYDNYLKIHNFKLVQSDFKKPDGSPLYEQDGSTYFAFFVPVPSAEDLFLLTQMRSAKILTDKFIASLLMVDFQNPVFSEKRTSLQQYAEPMTTGTIINGVSSVPDEFANKVKAVAASQPDCDSANWDTCSSEQQFLFTWNLPDDQWKTSVQQRIQTYLDEINNLSESERLDRLMRLAVKRRSQFQSWPTIKNLQEFSLLLPQTDLPQ